MDSFDKRWTTQDRDGNPIYLTQERWEYIRAISPSVDWQNSNPSGKTK
jgi:hypothetical protein